MKAITGQLLVLISIWLPLSMSGQLCVELNLPASDIDRIRFEKALAIRHHFPDSSLKLLEQSYHHFIQTHDTLNAVYVLSEQAHIYGHQALYKESYDKLWKALLLADEANIAKAKAHIYLDIGRYYSFYKRRKKTIEYFDLALRINRGLVENSQLDKSVLATNYYAYCSTFRELNEPGLGSIYLDSCRLYHSTNKSKIHKSYLDFERAFLFKESGKYVEAIDIYENLIPWLEEKNPGYQVLVYTYMGDAYRMMNDFSKSEDCYQTALITSETYNSHIDFIPLVYKKLSELYFWRGDYKAAFQSISKSKVLDEKFFDSRSKNNRPLLEILDAFRLEKEAQKKLIQEKKLAQLEHEEKILFLQRTILMVCLIFVALITIVFFRHIRTKYVAEKQLIQKKQELEIQKVNEMIEMKNRELSASTLKLIQKEEFITKLKEKIARNGSDMNIQDVKRLINNISASNQQNWKEFEARFIDVNKDFYCRLKAAYPKLTQGDLKLCALIKLNFSSKDMAKLMGISVESVHTTRYRLRKKLGLQREVNLTEYISNF